MQLEISAIGRIAQQVFSGVNRATIWGVTSRGVFLHIPSGWMVFLSGENCHGPLTVNLGGNVKPLLSLVPGSSVAIHDSHLSFQNLGIDLHFENAIPWEPPALPGSALARAARQNRLFSTIQAVSKDSPLNARKGLLREVLVTLKEWGAMEVKDERSSQFFSHPELFRLILALNRDEPAALGEALAPFIGRGSGLTPSGDDLLVGLLLTLNRWGLQLYPTLELRIQMLNRAAIKASHLKTTLLSANLIECAALGQADERLIAALDGLIAGVGDANACASCLLDWGSSSGSDALAGITLALMAINP